MALYSIDWANDTKNVAVFDGKTCRQRVPQGKPGMVIATENIPMEQARPLLDKGARVFTCGTNVVAAERERLDVEKTHEADAKIIYQLYKEKPEIFREMKYHPILTQFSGYYAVFKQSQKMRVAANNRLYSSGREDAASCILDNCRRQEKQLLNTLTRELENMPVYTDFLSRVRGVGPATAAGLISHTGDITRFPTVSHFMSYFGLDVEDGKAPKKQKGEAARWHHKGRSHLLGVIGDGFVKGRYMPYRRIYDDEKAKQLPICYEKKAGKKGYKQWAHRRAIRKMVKEFVKEFFGAYKRLGCGLFPQPAYESSHAGNVTVSP